MKDTMLTNKFFASILLVLFIVLAFSAPANAATQQSHREKAIATFEASNFVDAIPLLEQAAVATPDDAEILSRLGFALYAISVTEKDAARRQKMRERALQVLMKSRAHGDNSNLTQITVDSLTREDPADIPFSALKAADSEIRKGEEAFVRGDMDQALAAYKRALELDPHLYEAALYAGDVEFKRAYVSKDDNYRNEHFDKAGVWFAKAIAINPDRETAYRYWGDALDAQGKTEAARDKFVEAIVADPYSGQRSYVGLTQWADRHQVGLGHPQVEIPTNVAAKKPGEVNITLDASILKGKDDGAGAWLMYGIVRSGWMDRKEGGRSEKFAKAHPKESAYRHSLAEEMEALSTVVESVRTQTKAKEIKKLTPSLENLMRLNEAGLVEAYVLFARPDEGIVRDYFAYRKANREKLKQYWLKFVVTQE